MKRIFAISLIFSIPLWGNINQNNDVQLWLSEEADIRMSKKTSLSLSNEWRIGDDISKLYFFYLQGICNLQCTPFLVLGPGYRQLWHLRGGSWKTTYEPLIDVILSRKKEHCRFQFRNRFSYLENEAAPNFWQYRARAWIFGSLSVGERVLEPYLSNEIFVRSDSGFAQNRIVLGTLVPLVSVLKGNFYYMLRFLKRDDWILQHVFGTWLTLRF